LLSTENRRGKGVGKEKMLLWPPNKTPWKVGQAAEKGKTKQGKLTVGLK